MTYEPGYLRERSKEIIRARNWGIGVITALIGLGFLVSEIQRLQAFQFDILQYAYLVLFAVTWLLVFLWIWATQRELDLLFDWLDPERYVPPSSIKETLLILFFGVTLAGMLLAARNPWSYGVVFTTYSAVLLAATSYVKREIEKAIVSSKSRARKDTANKELEPRATLYLRGIDALEHYFLKRPQVLRLTITLIASTAASAFGVWFKLGGPRITGLIAYLGFATTIVVSEFVIGRWRCVRDGAIRKILCELSEHERRGKEQPTLNP